VKGSGQLYLRQELLSIFFVNLSHPDSTVAETAFTCVLNFRLPYLEPYSDRLRRIFKVKELRDALLDFPLSKENEVIHQDHRKQLVPILLRILFGRLAAGSMRGTSSKDTPLARRKAIISFLAQLEIGEIFPLIYLMVRNYAPLTFELKWEDVGLASYEADLLTCFKTSESTHFVDMPIQRHQGFLNLLLVLVSHLKGKLSEFVPTFMYILIGIMKFACVGGVDEAGTCSDLEDDGENEGNTSSHRRRSARALSFRCAAILMDQYALDVDFVPFTRSLWEAILDSVENLPGAVAKSNSTPTVLALLVVLSSHARLLPILKGNDEVVDNVLLCIGPLSADKAVDAVLDFVLHLLDYGEGFITGSQIVLLLRQFRARFGGFLEDSENSRNHRKTPGSIISKELSVLSIIGDMIFDGRIVLGLDNDDDAEVLDTLSGLLIRLLLNAHAHEHDQLSALAAISAMLSRIHVDVAKSHFFSLSILLKYEHWKRLSLTVRREVTAALSALALRDGSGGSLYRMSGVIEDALALHPKRIQEIDYDRVLPALSGLCEGGGGRGWASLLVSEGSSRRTDGLTQDSEPKLLTPLVHSCFSLLLNEDDTVVSRSAYSALRSLVQTASNEENVLPDKSGSSWSKFIETCVVPGARAALRCNSEQTRRHAVSLIAEVCKGFSSSLSPNLHGDLDFLRCDANPDLDFFVNILHVQIHRRCRALQRLRSRLNAASDDSIGPPLSVQSLSKVLLPLALSPIYDNSPSSDDTLAQESIATVGAIARKLSFSKYHEVLWTALNQLSRRQHNEKLLVGMICSTLDSFHFELTSADAHLSERQQTSVWRALERRVIPKIEGLLVKEISDGRGGTSRTLRPNVVLALLKLLKKFPSEYFVNKLPRLLAIVCGALKNRDSNVRDLARKALAAMTVELGTAYLSEVVKSLAVSLTEGYQLHVRIATLHYILLQIESCHRGRGDASVAFDACVPGMMDLILQDLFGSASETKDNTDASKRLVKEASGSKSSDAVEIISRLIVFCPSEPKDRSSVHTIVLPFLEKLRDPTLDPKSTTKTKECLRRVVSGLSRNPSVNVEDMLEFIYATISPVIEGQENMYENRLADAKNKAVVVVWQPSMGGTHSKKDAVTYKFLDQTQLVRVRDGASAPKLTGSARHEQKMSGDILNSPAGACAMEFGLNLLLSTLKKSRIDSDLEPRLRPFLTLLTRCICESRHNVATMIALRCTAIIFKKGIQPCEAIVNPLGSKIVDLLSAGEININTNEEMAHVCMIALMTLLKLQIPHKSGVSVESRAVLSLTDDQMDIIVSLLKEFLAISDSTTAALGVVKALQSLKFMSSGFYDLMEQILDLSVRSHRDTFRDVSALPCMMWWAESMAISVF
jgi:U3 small nucleolar RNA-associated protein 20